MRLEKKFILLFALASYTSVEARQSPTEYNATYAGNSVKVWAPYVPISDAQQVLTSDANKVLLSTSYTDGLGRVVQQVTRHGAIFQNENGQSVNRDLVVPMAYDDYGLDSRKYLPFAANMINGNGSVYDGGMKLNPLAQQQWYYSDANPVSPIKGQGETAYYSETDYEKSPLIRPKKEMAPGNNWVGAGRGVQTQYFHNTTADDVKVWSVSYTSSGFGAYTVTGSYAPNELFKVIQTDENGFQVITFTDKSNRVLLKKVQSDPAVSDDGSGSNDNSWACTYYLYDDRSQLRCVIQPEGVKLAKAAGWASLSSNILNEYCFRYEYDGKGQIIRKKVPGAAEVYMVYDAKSRLVMTQDGGLRTAGKWLVTLYDALGRVVETGWLMNSWSGGKTFSQHLSDAAVSGTYPFAPGSTPASPTWERLSRTGYDTYTTLPGASGLTASFDNSWSASFITTYNTAPKYAQPLTATTNLKGLAAWTEIKVLGMSSQYVYQVHFYDHDGRLIQTKSKNLTGGVDVATTQWDWKGIPLVRVEFTRKSGTPVIDVTVVSRFEYDALSRMTSITKEVTTTEGGTTVSSPEVRVVDLQYDALGRVTKKGLGQQRNSSGTYTADPIEDIKVDYNVRSWMLGMNRSYLQGMGNARFGFELAYDKRTSQTDGFTSNIYDNALYNGNINGMIWRSVGDGEKRKYDFSYDPMNRLTKAKFTEASSSWVENDAKMNFSVGGNSATGGTIKYDLNGNIMEMWQKGRKITGSDWVDKMTYSYDLSGQSNRLVKVTDGVTDAANGKLGDFKDGSNGNNNDYRYDINGNMIADRNKAIGDGSSDGITYNFLNLPELITARTPTGTVKGTITYLYDASGAKLRKTVVEYGASVSVPGSSPLTSDITTVTNYIGGSVFESRTYSNSAVPGSYGYADKLELIGHEEGRIRVLRQNASQPLLPTGIAFDYFLKDHLGNVRMVLTDQQQKDFYPAATLEGSSTAGASSKLNYEHNYYEINSTYVVNKPWSNTSLDYANHNGNPPSNDSYPSGYTPASTATSEKVYKLNAQQNKTGLGIVLKVMAGDKIDIFGKSYYAGTGTYNNSNSTILLVSDLLGGLLSAPDHAGIGGKGLTLTDLQTLNNGLIPAGFIRGANGETSSVPKAYINFILLDDQFRFVSGDFSRVGTSGAVKDHWFTDGQLQDIGVAKNGYLYVYVSNESNVDVFFDNLQLIHTRGAIVEETHYYPFGLSMAGISSKALEFGEPGNIIKFQNQEFTSKEFSDGNGLDMYEFKWRMHDPQIGRFWQIDPLADKYRYNSTYAFSENKVIAHVELEGLEAWTVNASDGTTEAFSGPWANQAAAQRAYNEYFALLRGEALSTGDDGMISSGRINVTNRVKKLEQAKFKSGIKGIVLHRTVSSTAASTLRAFNNGRGGVNYGTHFVIDKDGTIMQTASLLHFTLHVGKVRKKTYPVNSNSIGIEVVGMYDDKTETWETPTYEQTMSTAWLVNSLRQTYNLSRNAVYKHEKISYKTAGEGAVVYDAILRYLFTNLTPATNNTTTENTSDNSNQRRIPVFF